MVLRQSGHHIGTLFEVVGHVHPGLPVVLTLLHHVVCDLGASVVHGRVPGQTDALSEYLRQFNGSHRGAGATCRQGGVIII